MIDEFSMSSSLRAARLPAAGFASVVAIVLIASRPIRADVTWTLPAGHSGDWCVASNWGGAVPTNTDTAYVVNGGTATVTMPGETCLQLWLGNPPGSGTVQMTDGDLSTFGTESIGNLGRGSFMQSGGTNSADFLHIGNIAGSNGTYNLSDSGLISVYVSEAIGVYGTGIFTQSGGANSAYDLTIGDYAGSSGTYSLSGNGSLSVTNQNVGYNGPGIFAQLGGTNSVTDTLVVGGLAYDISGTYTLSGSGQLSAAYESVGYYGPGTFTQSGGINSVIGDLTLGLFSGGTYNLSGGMLILAGLDQHPGAVFNFSGGTIQASSVLSTNVPMTLSNSGGSPTFDSNGNAVTLYGSLSGPGSLTKIGSGTLTLSASNSYSGMTTVSAGILSLANPAALAGGGNITFSGGTLQYTDSNSQDYSGKIVGSTGPISIDTNGVSVTFASNLISSNTGGLNKIGNGTLTLATTNAFSGNTLISGGTLALASPLALQQSTLDTSGSGVLSFESLTAATLGGLTGPGTLGLGNASSSAVALSVGNNNANTTFSGMLQGAGSLTKVGTGGLLLSGSNSYTGGTAVNAGTLQVGNGGNGEYLASPAVSNSGVLVFNHADALTYSGVISGSGSVVETGGGTLAIKGSNTYTGPTTISQGKLVLDGWLTSSAVSVNSGGTLGGTGYLSSVTINAGGNLAPGDSLGTLNVGGTLILQSGAVMDYELDTPSTSDMIVAGSLTLNSQQFSDFTFTPTANFAPGSYALIGFGSSSGSLGANTSGTIDGYPATLAVQGNDLVVSVVPEPLTAALLAAGVLGLIGWEWRRRLRKIRTRVFEENRSLIRDRLLRHRGGVP